MSVHLLFWHVWLILMLTVSKSLTLKCYVCGGYGYGKFLLSWNTKNIFPTFDTGFHIYLKGGFEKICKKLKFLDGFLSYQLNSTAKQGGRRSNLGQISSTQLLNLSLSVLQMIAMMVTISELQRIVMGPAINITMTLELHQDLFKGTV